MIPYPTTEKTAGVQCEWINSERPAVLSIVIPTLNAARTLEATLAAVTGMATEIIVVDGGSADDTQAIAAARRAQWVEQTDGRGAQLAAGARIAHGEWLLFLHADTVPAPGWEGEAEAYMKEPANRDGAAVFRFRLDDTGAEARRLERMVAWRGRVLGLPYGDQGLLMSRRLYGAVGGFQNLPLMEDVDMARRLGRDRLSVLDVNAVTSAARYRGNGYLLRPMRNLTCLGLYLLGLPMTWIKRVYG